MVGMYIAESSWTNRLGKTYSSIWLRESYRENGKVKTRNLFNLKDWPQHAIDFLQDGLDSWKNPVIVVRRVDSGIP